MMRKPGKSVVRAGGALVLLAMTALLAACSGSEDGRDLAASLTEIEALIAQQSMREALVELKALVQQHPQSTEPRLALGEFYLGIGAGPAARDELTRARELGASGAAMDAALINALLLSGDLDVASERINDHADRDSSPALQTLLGEAALAQGDLVKARIAFGDALHLDPANLRAQLGDALVARGQNRLDDARSLVTTLLAADMRDYRLYLLAGDLALAEDRRDDAIDHYRTAAKQNPFQAQPLWGEVRAHLAGNDFDQAHATIDQGLKLFPDDLPLRLLRGYAFYQARVDDRAVDELRGVLSQAPNYPLAQLYLGMVLERQGKTEQALDQLSGFLATNPGHPGAVRLVAALELRRGRAEAALEVLKTLESDDAGTLILKGSALNALGKRDEGRALFDRAVALNGDNELVWNSVVMSQLSGGDMSSLIPMLSDKAGGDSGDSLSSALWLSFAYMSRGDWPAALASAQDAIKANGEKPGLLNAVGMAHAGAGDNEAARAAFLRGLALAPASTELRRNLVTLELRDNNIDAARKLIDELPESLVETPYGRHMHAQLALLDGEADKAISLLETIRVEDPQDMDSRRMLASTYLNRGENALAEVIAREMLALRDGDQQAHVILATVLMRKGDLVNAETAAVRAASLGPDSAPANLIAGTLNMMRGNHDDALDFLKRAASLEPANTRVLETLAYAQIARDPEGAIKTIKQLRKITGETGTTLDLFGEEAASHDDYATAADYFGRSFAETKSAESAIKYSDALMRTGKLDEAIALLEEMRTIDRSNPRILEILAPMYEDADKVGEASAVYDALLSVDADSLVALNNYALIKLQAGEPGALALAERAFELAPDNHQVVDTYAWTLTNLGSTNQGELALQLFERAVSPELAPEQLASIRYHQAVALAKFGDRQDAIDVLEAVVSMKVDFDEREKASTLLTRLKPR